jgi:hypothetical protein
MNPFAPRYAPSRVRALPTETHEEIESSFRKAQSLFETAEKDTISGRSWIARAITWAVNCCAAFTIWKIYGDRIENDGGDPRKEAMKNFLIGMISGELKIISMPKRAIGDINEYRRRFGSLSEENPEQAVRYFALPFHDGVMVGAAYSW